jgi:ABC-type amino acid transport substrate-binding protein
VPLLRTPIAVALPKNNPDLLREVNATIEALKTSGELASMAAQLPAN